MKITAGPYLQNVTSNGITVMWHTDRPAPSRLEYERARRLGWSAYDLPPAPVYPEAVEDHRMVTVHAVTLNGLDEEWRYFYRVSSTAADGARAVSEGASFRTAPGYESPFRFVTYGDSMHIHTVHERNAQLARSYRPDICVGAGDVVRNVIEHYAEDFFVPAAELLAYTPWFAAMGNHDSPNEGYFSYFSYPQPRYWYSFNYGCAHFVILNTCLDYRPGSEQWIWLERDLRLFKDMRWKFVFFHHPPYCSSDCEIAGTRVLCPLFEQYGVDVVYNAHATRYERFYPLRGGRYDSNNGVIYIVSGGGGYDMSYPCSQHWDHIHPFSAMCKSANHFLLTHVAADECTVRAIDTDDRLFDILTLTKPVTAHHPPASLIMDAENTSDQPLAPQGGTVLAGFPQAQVRWVCPPSQWAADDQVSRSDGFSLRWHSDGGQPVLPAIRRIIQDNGTAREIAGGKSYQLSAWMRTQDLSAGATLSFSWSGDMGFLDRVESRPLAGTNDWTPVTVQTPPLPDYVYWCRIVLSARPGARGTAWFDDVQVKEIDG